MAQIMIVKLVTSRGLWDSKNIYPPFYRSFIHNGYIVVFSSVITVSRAFVKHKVTDVQCNASVKSHRWTASSAGSGNEVNILPFFPTFFVLFIF